MHPTTYNAKAYSAASATSGLASTKINRRDPTDRDVQIEILFCGICHSDLHSVRNEWSEFMATNYPIVPGHEIVGRVIKVGSAVTTYKPGDLAAVGGLGHMAVKFAHALGAHVVVLTHSPGKKEDALRLGADEVVVSSNADEMKKHAGSFDFILDAVSADHDINAYINLLGIDGNLTLVGAPAKPLGITGFGLIARRRSFSGSMIGGIPETQEMLDFCGKHNITADVEIIPIQKVNEAYERLLKSDVKYRFSIDMASLKS